jgi:hypothetical protein
MKNLTEIEKGWIAGIMEGEGSLKWNEKGSSQGQIRLQLQMTDKDVVEKLANLLETNITEHLPKNLNHKKTWRISIKNWDKVEEIAKTLLPYMGNRRTEEYSLVLEKAEKRKEWIAQGGRNLAWKRKRNNDGSWEKN